jgi:hypothetical protein
MFPPLESNGRHTALDPGRRKETRRREQKVIVRDFDAASLFDVHQVLQLDPEGAHQPLHPDTCDLHRCRMQPKPPIGRRTERCPDGERKVDQLM